MPLPTELAVCHALSFVILLTAAEEELGSSCYFSGPLGLFLRSSEDNPTLDQDIQVMTKS